MRRHPAGRGADEEHQVGRGDDAVRAFARIAADNPYRERVRGGNAVLAVERGGDRDRERLGERDELGAGARPAHAAAGDDHRSLSSFQILSSFLQVIEIRSGAKGGHARELRLDERLHLRFFLVELSFVAAELQVHRTGRARGGDAKRLAQHVREALDGVHRGVPLRHRLERRHVVDLLVDLAELGLRVAPAGEGDHRRVREPGVAQPGGQVQRADDLCHAYAGLAASARIAVGHVSRGFFAVGVDAADRGAALHLRERAAQHRRDHEDMRHAVAGEHLRQDLRSAGFHLIASGLVGEPTAPVMGIAGATNRNS